MEMTRSTRDSLSQRLELGCYEPSAHRHQAVTDSAEVGCGWEPWKVMRWASCVLISPSRRSAMPTRQSKKVGRVARVWLVSEDGYMWLVDCGW
jgi:hypothetical protein